MKSEEFLPFKDVRSEVPLSNADFAAIRAKVMTAVTRREKSRIPLAIRFAFAALAVVLLGLAAFLIERPSIAPKTQPRLPMASVPKPPAGVGPVTPPREAAAPPHHPKRIHTPKPQMTVAAASPMATTDMRMEIQTADPDVRIIWIVKSR